MTKDDLELAKQEFTRDRDLWTDLLLKRRFYYQDLLTRVTDRQVNHILTLTTIAVALISIVIPITNLPFFSIIPICLLSLSIILGTSLVLYTIFHDKNGIPKTRDAEVEIYSKFQSAANSNFNKAYSGNLTWNDVKDYFDLRKTIEEDLSKLKPNKILEKLKDTVYISFLVTFFLGLIIFLGLFFYKY